MEKTGRDDGKWKHTIKINRNKVEKMAGKKRNRFILLKTVQNKINVDQRAECAVWNKSI